VRSLSKRAGLVATLMLLVAFFAAPVAGAAPVIKGGGDIVPPTIPASEPLAAGVANVQAWLNSRLSQLHQLSLLVAATRSLTPADRIALSSVIDSDASGLGLLEVSVSTAQSVAVLNADSSQMVLNYHVFALAAPEIKDVIGADRSLAGSQALMRQIPEIEATVSASGLRSESESAATELLGELPGRLQDAQQVLNGVVPALLALTPSSIPGSLPTLVAAASAVRAAAGDIRAADTIVAKITVIVAGTGRTSHARR
jgi:hypothetical protein